MGILNEAITWLTDPAHWTGPTGIPNRMAEHITISAVSLLIALAIALPVGLYIGHTRRGAGLAINAANLWRSLPSLAVIAIVIPITAAIDPRAGFLIYPTVVAMVVLAVPPVLVNTFTGIAGVDADAVEAARGQGMSERQLLTRVEVPLAIPVIVTGIRSAAVQVVATATLGAVFGFGGLGRYLVDGIATYSLGGTSQIYGGVVLVGTLVIATDLMFAAIQRLFTPRALRMTHSGIDAAERSAEPLPA
ncbi:MAG: ABC transporter permease [Candidatus Limnocylindrales bacterium]